MAAVTSPARMPAPIPLNLKAYRGQNRLRWMPKAILALHQKFLPQMREWAPIRLMVVNLPSLWPGKKPWNNLPPQKASSRPQNLIRPRPRSLLLR